MRRHTIAIAAGLLGALLIALVAPKPLGLRGQANGDSELVSQIDGLLGTGFRHHLVALRLDEDGKTSFAGWGADEHTEFEIGSVTKTFTAAAFADAIDRGEVDPDTRLDEVFPDFRDRPAGSVTLAELATQHSGLSRLLESGAAGVGVQTVRGLLGFDPYTLDKEEFLTQAAESRVSTGQGGKKEYGYSNLGFALLGQAVAKRAGMEYPELIRTRILAPLGMDETTVPTEASDLGTDAPRGFDAAGLPTGRWTMRAQAPAGSMRSTAHDMGLWLQAVATGKAPGVKAVKARADAGSGQRIGYAWMHTGAGTVWHNGGTGGFSCYLGFAGDRKQKDGARGIVVLSDTATSVDEAQKVIEP
ncbi:beta-lactamase family protein [Brevibacterium sp. 50QC2O2]|uniref:serine hydrolase domain-containing protein n=1 Tax=Brevibacterium sp. 50QC2O2 TaxID=2968459 RepID=UPI00211D0105|nr:serine hydrolase domain-containing protein [Brevibacterium sp. 50QC2O2]MCQ9387189.1 beta-lactamase family protein [Brevibacterium sp. 50QC2O2]